MVVSAVGIYLAFLVLLRIVGQRALASMSSFDLAAAIAVGAVMGRSLLGYTPTLLAGVIGLATLFALQLAFGLLRRTPRLQALMSNPPVVLLRDGRVLHGNLRAGHLIEDELREAAAARHPQLRRRGLRRLGTHRITVALPAGSAVLAYLLGLVGTLLDLPQAVLDLSPFAWLPRPGEEASATAALVLVLVGLAAAAVGTAGFVRRDVTGA